MSNSNTPPKEAAALLPLAFGFALSQTLYIAADLGLADYLAHESLTADELATRTGSNPDALGHLLRSLVAFGILTCDGKDRFTTNVTGNFLRSDVPGSMRALVRFLVGPWYWRAWENLPHSIRTGAPAF